MQLSSPSRRHFLSQSVRWTAAGSLLAAGISHASQTIPGEPGRATLPRASHYQLLNVRLEEGFEQDGGEVIATRTALYDITINDGKFAAFNPAGKARDNTLPNWDAQGLLLLPRTRDMHIHLDKTFYSGPWQAPRPRQGKTIMDMIAREQVLIPQLLPTSQARAEALIGLLQSKGTTEARSHCNIDPVSGLQSLEHLQLALANHPAFDCEIVAFPQHGLLHSQVDGLMREAMSLGVQYVGGLDPTNVDGAMQASLDAMFQIALDFKRGVDIHLHETSPAGVAAIQYMVDTIGKNPQLRGKVTLSHGFALGTLEGKALDKLIAGMAEQQMNVASTIPIGKLTMPLPQLQAAGIQVMTGTDSVIDHWSPFGTGSMLEKANLYAQLYRGSDEFGLSRALHIATGGILPLSNQGVRQWPQVQDEASMMLVQASCSAEAVARIAPVRATFRRGTAVYSA
ncbi:amidohydrolase family protein [Pantoea cypripedii]|uniref:amidohydrolase family protein n=1 Tax=Pantoea cypripedii TaxID=55209 RepID=UPI002FC7222C